MVLDGQRMGDERDWVLVGFFVTCSSSAEKRFMGFGGFLRDVFVFCRKTLHPTGETRRDGAVGHLATSIVEPKRLKASHHAVQSTMAARKSCTHMTWKEAKSKSGDCMT